MKNNYGKTALFLTAMLWGTTFAIGKIAAEVYSASFIIALRFTVASAVLILVTLPLRKLIDKQYLIDGFWMGVTLFLSYLLQVIGLTMDTSPGKSAFLCTTYCVMIPFFHWFITKRRPKLLHVACVFLCLIGVGVLSLQGSMRMSTGDIMTVLSGVPCAVNMVISSIICKDNDKNPLLLTTIELFVVMVCAWICVFASGGMPVKIHSEATIGIVYLGVIATALCLFLQSYGLKHTEAAIGGMIISLESVFGVIFSILIYHEKVTLRMWIGFILIFMAILLSQREDAPKDGNLEEKNGKTK